MRAAVSSGDRRVTVLWLVKDQPRLQRRRIGILETDFQHICCGFARFCVPTVLGDLHKLVPKGRLFDTHARYLYGNFTPSRMC